MCWCGGSRGNPRKPDESQRPKSQMANGHNKEIIRLGGMKMDIYTGMQKMLTDTVTMDNAAKTLGSGNLLVYGTPAMLLLVEKTAVALLDGQLDEGMTTVGTNLNVEHVSATPLGAEVTCQVELTEIDRKRLVFSVEVKDAAGVIGKGTHERFIVQAEKFQQKADGKFQA